MNPFCCLQVCDQSTVFVSRAHADGGRNGRGIRLFPRRHRMERTWMRIAKETLLHCERCCWSFLWAWRRRLAWRTCWFTRSFIARWGTWFVRRVERRGRELRSWREFHPAPGSISGRRHSATRGGHRWWDRAWVDPGRMDRRAAIEDARRAAS